MTRPHISAVSWIARSREHRPPAMATTFPCYTRRILDASVLTVYHLPKSATSCRSHHSAFLSEHDLACSKTIAFGSDRYLARNDHFACQIPWLPTPVASPLASPVLLPAS